MKLIIQNDRIAALATDDYAGPDAFIDAPTGFAIDRAGEYQVVDGVAVLPPLPEPPSLQEQVVTATQRRLDDFARTRGYDGILSACTYAFSAVPKFATEGGYAVQARDATWAALYALLAEVQAGTRPMPTSFDDVAHLLPAMEWP